ncbi:MAG: hypothetical protein HONDAALG_02597 [Gammaproteobacteria bacterium]|nr:hypothetical protein [Gammaproteobacteria bacterium]
MTIIRELLARDLTQKIEEIIKVDQADAQSVYSEITEYVATDRIKEQYRDLLRAIAEAPSDPHEGVGVWISGFFGSGKSSFAKILGYVLANREVLGHRASDLFNNQVDDRQISELVEFINARIPTEVVMFDVSVDRAVKKATERIAEIMYTVLLRELGYAQDYDIAELEIELEAEGKLERFVELCREMKYGEWTMVRKGAQKISRASAILHTLDPSTYATPDSWSHSLRDKSADITVGRFVERTFELTARRRPGRALVFIIDEVGQYVARSADKIEDLRAVVEQLGKESKNRLKAKKAVAPVWVVVTSQEKIDEVVAAIDSKRVELAKLQDRFKHRIDLAPADIREVATRRVLAKTPDAEKSLRTLFNNSQGQLNAACRLERTTRKSEVTEEDFIQFYPYLPHYIEMSIDIMSGIRLQPGAPRHLGGSNRTIIKQAYEMLVSHRTALADRAVGTLVTLDKIFELVEGNLSSEKQKDVSDVSHRFESDGQAGVMAARVAKAICLLEFVSGIPRTEANIAACLVERVGQPAPLTQVQEALKLLEAAQFVRNTEEGWKLQTAQEKNWDTERRAIEPRPKDRNEITRETLREIFEEPQLRNYRYRNLRTFTVGISVDGVPVGAGGDVPLSIWIADAAESFPVRLEEARGESREGARRNDVYWVFALTSEIDDLQARLYASRQMNTKYEQLRAQNRITSEEAASLSAEKHEANRLQARLREKMLDGLEKGQGLFRGVQKDAAALGNNAGEIFKKLFDFAFPDLYPKLEMGFRPLTGKEVDEILKAANLNALSPVFYDGEKGLELVIKEGAKYVPNPSAPVAKEILDYIRREHSYGNKVTGKSLVDHFHGIGYGWEPDMVRLVMAVLLRAGSIEVTHQGRRFRNYQDPNSRAPFTAIPAFRAASFAPRESIDLKTLTSAVRHLEELTGEEVEIEESAIAAVFKKVADDELKLLLPVAATVQANNLPVGEMLEEYRQTLTGVQAAGSDDCVRILAGEGKTFKETRDRVRRIREAVSSQGLAAMRQARMAASRMWPLLEARGLHADLQTEAEKLQSLLTSPAFFEELVNISKLSQQIGVAYRAFYTELHERRTAAFAQAVEEIKGRAEWGQLETLSEDTSRTILAPLAARACDKLDWQEGATECQNCKASIGEMESDIAALSGLKAQALAQVRKLTTLSETEHTRIAHVNLAEFFSEALDSEQSVNEAVERLRDHLLKLIAEGAKIILE